MTGITVATDLINDDNKWLMHKHRRYVFFLVLAGLWLAWVAFDMLRADLAYFRLEKNVSQWTSSLPPELDDVNNAFTRLKKIHSNTNPKTLLLYAWLCEWQAFLKPSQARFYLLQSDQKLTQVIGLTPSDSRIWAYRSVIAQKLGWHEKSQLWAEKAEHLGRSDQETLRVLAKLGVD